jgi:hypothetical protein
MIPDGFGGWVGGIRIVRFCDEADRTIEERECPALAPRFSFL